jgi:hypothetical protein
VTHTKSSLRHRLVQLLNTHKTERTEWRETRNLNEAEVLEVLPTMFEAKIAKSDFIHKNRDNCGALAMFKHRICAISIQDQSVRNLRAYRKLYGVENGLCTSNLA